MIGLARPEIKYTKSKNVHIAYQVFGNGPINIVFTPGSVSHQDLVWEYRGLVKFLEGLGQIGRIVHFDKRGTGLSDRDIGIPTFEERMDDIRAVMDAAGFETAVLLGFSEGVPMSAIFAAVYPSRTKGLILYGGEARGLRTKDYPWAPTQEDWEAIFRRTEETWGTKEADERRVLGLAPSCQGDDNFTRWLSSLFRMGGSLGSHLALARSEMMLDIRNILPTIHVPTLVLHFTEDRACSVEEGRYIASRIPGAKFVEMPGKDHLFYVNENLTELVLRELRNFISGIGPATEVSRVLTTVLFTDIVDSTAKNVELGDRKWQDLMAKYNSLMNEKILKFRGMLVKTTGDGILATFDGPTRALRCAWEMVHSVEALGIKMRAGVHTGECVLDRGDISGIAVNVASRILDEAGAGQVMISSTVRDLVYGSGIVFQDHDEYKLKGIEEKRRLFSLASLGELT